MKTVGVQTVLYVFAVILRLGLNILAAKEDVCPAWFTFDILSEQCTYHSLKEWVICDQRSGEVKIVKGWCMTYDNRTGVTDVGRCPYTLLDAPHMDSGYIEVPNDTVDLNEFVCGFWNREGYLCSKCKEGYGLTIANIFQKCIECRYPKALGWLFYFMLQLIPLTVLFFVVSIFRISLARPPLNAFVVFCQFCNVLLFLHAYRFYPPYIDSYALQKLHYFVFVGLGIWSMTLTRYLDFGITNFCVDSDINIQQAFTLTQIQSLFPLFLVFITHASIVLHTRNYRLVVWLWRPFHRCYVRFSRVWNSKLSLVDVFSTFLLLSHSRFVFQLYYIFSFQYTYRLNDGQNPTASLLYNPAIPYFHPLYHLPYALLLLFTFLIVVVLPTALLTCYQFKAFQTILACIHLHHIPSVHIFVDIFQGCYKDGTNGTFDLRFVSSFYMILRIVLLFGSFGCNSTSYYDSCSLVVVFMLLFLLLLFFALVRPYKVQRMNTLDSLLLASLSLISFLLIITTKDSTLSRIILIFVLLIVVIPQVVLYSYFICKIFKLFFKIHFFNTFAIQVKKAIKCPVEQPVENSSFDLSESFLNRTDNYDDSEVSIL